MESDGPEKYKSQALCLHQTPRPRPGLGCKHHPPTTKDFSEIDICFFQFHIGTQIKTKKGNRVGGTEKSNIYVLRQHKTPRVARDWVVSTIPRQRNTSMRQMFDFSFNAT